MGFDATVPGRWRCMDNLEGLTPPTNPAVPRRVDWFRKKFAGIGPEGSGKLISRGGGRGVDSLDFETFLVLFLGLFPGPVEDARLEDVERSEDVAVVDRAGGR